MNEDKKIRLVKILDVIQWITLFISIIAFLISLRSKYSLQYIGVAIFFWLIVIGLKFWKQKLLGKKIRL